MNLGRKQALVAFLAGIGSLLPWTGRRAHAQTPLPPPTGKRVAPDPQGQIDDLKRRLAAVEAALAKQVAFTKDGAGNLTLAAAGSVMVSAGSNLTLKAAGPGTLQSGGTMTIRGPKVDLNP